MLAHLLELQARRLSGLCDCRCSAPAFRSRQRHPRDWKPSIRGFSKTRGRLVETPNSRLPLLGPHEETSKFGNPHIVLCRSEPGSKFSSKEDSPCDSCLAFTENDCSLASVQSPCEPSFRLSEPERMTETWQQSDLHQSTAILSFQRRTKLKVHSHTLTE